MKLKQLFTDDDAVSPVIGVILMVAITVILAAVIGAFVLDIGGSQETTPTANFDFEYNADSSGDSVVVTMTSGETIPAEDTVEIVGGSNDNRVEMNSGSEIASGDSITLDSEISSGDTLRVVWTSESGDTSTEFKTYEVPSDFTA